MSDYQQPLFYRFNQDSLELVRFIKKTHLDTVKSILDLGAGSGIMGIELSCHFNPSLLRLVELQKEFMTSIEFNLKHFLPKDVHSEVIIKPFSEFHSSIRSDLIICNPPYYLPGSGRASKDVNRFYARSFQKDNWSILLDRIEENLLPQGRAYLVVKNDELILKKIDEEIRKKKLSFEKIKKDDLVFFILVLTE